MDKFIDVKTIFKNSKTVIKTGKINDDTYIMKIQDNKYIKNEIHIYKYIRKFDNNKNYVSCPKSISKISQTQYALIFPYDIHKIPLYKYILKHNYSYKTILDISLKASLVKYNDRIINSVDSKAAIKPKIKAMTDCLRRF